MFLFQHACARGLPFFFLNLIFFSFFAFYLFLFFFFLFYYVCVREFERKRASGLHYNYSFYSFVCAFLFFFFLLNNLFYF
ncbi:hypothetical protein DFH27DRAFT_562124 [Peziza echinospora]|nr:hypothetical protein DFH27DRAFT_562124 [Peziza echinospora]